MVVTGMSVKGNPEIKEDVWVKSTCGGCYGTCAIRAHRVNGVLVKIEGEPDIDFGSRGGECAKGLAMIQALYDPNRYNYPLRRTNPEKGIFADPKWKRISWDEALNEIAEKLKKIRQENPNKLFHGGTPSAGSGPDLPLGFGVFGAVFGTKNWHIGGGGLALRQWFSYGSRSLPCFLVYCPGLEVLQLCDSNGFQQRHRFRPFDGFQYAVVCRCPCQRDQSGGL